MGKEGGEPENRLPSLVRSGGWDYFLILKYFSGTTTFVMPR